MKGAGTDAQVFIQIYGQRGKSDEFKMENSSEDSFEQGQVDKFMVGHGLKTEVQIKPYNDNSDYSTAPMYSVSYISVL